MTQERPTGSPLHGKRVYVYIGQTSGTSLDYVSFATEFSLSLSAQNTARAVVMGTDAVPDVEIHGLVAKVRINLLLTSSESDFLMALGATGTSVDYDLAVTQLLSRKGFENANRLDILIAPLENAPAALPAISQGVADADSLTDFRNKAGYVIELNAAAITSLEISGRRGEYTEARLEVESGRFKINASETTLLPE